jgi:Cys-tRNA(Pro)/Cys-tRNA(Cys) deacylase
MTPAINRAKQAGIAFIVHDYEHDADAASYGGEAASKLGVDAARVFKTLVADADGQLIVGIVPVSSSLDLKALAAAAGLKRAQMADLATAERATGYVAGGISPIGQKKALRTILDKSADGFATIFVSAGRRGLEIELAPADLIRLSNGKMAAIAR